MTSEPNPDPSPTTTSEWAEREHYWRRKLGRLRLGVEPIEDQLARYRRVTLLLTAVPLGIGLMFVGLFAAFRRPDVGALVVGVLLVPIVLLAWLDYGLLYLRAQAYRRERDRYAGRNSAGP